MVNVREEIVLIPTYDIEEYDKNPMFLEKRVYQGSSGRVYPHPVCEGVNDIKHDKEYKAIFLENDYILVMILPELGGRIQRLLDKTNGYDAVYYNEVIKPALVGLAGPWISGGIEFNWPQHHRPSTFDPVDWKIVKNDDGSVTVWVGETEKMFHTKGAAGFTVYPDRAYLEITGRLYNPTDRPQTFLWWANPAVSVNDYTRSIFPPDVHAVMDHGKRDVSKFPIADGVYYKVDYSPGTDISRYKNIPVPTSYMAYHSDFDFIGNYDDSKEAGLLHVADHHVSPGKKQWTWGNGDFGKAWDRNLTDENGPYIELMTGMFTDNQPDFTFLKPYEEKTFKQFFMPYKKCGAIKNANTEYALNVENEEGKCVISLYSMCDHMSSSDTIRVCKEGEILLEEKICLKPAESKVYNISENAMEVIVKVCRNGKSILSYEAVKKTEAVPTPASSMEKPEDVPTNEELFLNGTHLEQYRHATYAASDYYLEGLRRDRGDLRINNAYGKLLYKSGLFDECIPFFKAAIERSTMRNPNPYDCEPYFNLGLAYEKKAALLKGEADCTEFMNKAYDAFYKATWDGNMQDKAFYKLACIKMASGEYEQALEFIDKSLNRGCMNMKARTLKTGLLRLLGHIDDAKAYASKTLVLDPLDHGAYRELGEINGDLREWLALTRDDSNSFIELALTYMDGGLYKEAVNVLLHAPETDPMVNYYLYYCSEDEKYLKKAETSPSLYCFPNRIEDIPVLEYAIKANGNMARYYLGCLFYDKGNWEQSVELWEACKEHIHLATVYRNLSLAYYNKKHDEKKAYEYIKKAFEMDTTDVRVFFELDQYYKVTGASVQLRYENMMKHFKLLDKRDALLTEYVSVLNSLEKYDEALRVILDHNFHPWEGGEGKITAEYRRALIGLALAEENEAIAIDYLTRALSFPDNLGEGKLIGALDNDIYYYLAEKSSKNDEKEKYYKLAARGEMNLSSAMYYNDQPPEMMFFRALAIARLGNKDEAKDCFETMIAYGMEHMNDEVKIEYFAVSLPDFLIYEGDLNKRNKEHCNNMISLGQRGLSLI